MSNYEIELDDTEFTIDLFNIINNLWRGIKKLGWLVIVLAAITSGFACIQTMKSYYPYYNASATFAVNLRLDSDGSIYDDNLRASQLSKTFPYILNSSILRDVIAADLGEDYISEAISADNLENTNLFTITVGSADPKRAYDVLQSVIQNYPKVSEPVVGSTYLNMIEETGVPTKPVNQLSYTGSLKTGALPGAAVGISIIFLYVVTRRTIHKIEDLAGISNVKHLGVLPDVVFKKRGNNKNNTLLLNNIKLPYAYRENLYKIRTRVEKIANNKGLKSILITSAIPGEGKSTIAINFAMALAEGGKKVVLIDCDLRRPSIKNYLTYPEDFIGIENVIHEEVELKAALRHFDELKIEVLACNQPAANSSEMLGSPKMCKILSALEEAYDYVILDTAPSAILSDTADLAKLVDGVIFVIKQDYAKVNHIMEGLEHLSESSNIELIGCILNSSKAGLGSYGYGYGYGKYGRYGSYGYDRSKQQDELITEE